MGKRKGPKKGHKGNPNYPTSEIVKEFEAENIPEDKRIEMDERDAFNERLDNLNEK